MPLFLFIEIAQNAPATYQRSLLAEAARLPGVSVFDCDNHSEAAIVRYAAELLAQADRAVTLIEVTDETASFGGLRVLFEQLLRQPDKIRVFVNGSHPIAERMLSPLPAEALRRDVSEGDLLAGAEAFLETKTE
jgi:DNA-binding LacI/PurR family transcriptional regulator